MPLARSASRSSRAAGGPACCSPAVPGADGQRGGLVAAVGGHVEGRGQLHALQSVAAGSAARAAGLPDRDRRPARRGDGDQRPEPAQVRPTWTAAGGRRRRGPRPPAGRCGQSVRRVSGPGMATNTTTAATSRKPQRAARNIDVTPYSSGSAIAPTPNATIPSGEPEQGRGARRSGPRRPALHALQCAAALSRSARRPPAAAPRTSSSTSATARAAPGGWPSRAPWPAAAGAEAGGSGSRRPEVDPGGRRRRDGGELPAPHERHVGAAALQDDVVAEGEGRLADGVEDRAQRRLPRRCTARRRTPRRVGRTQPASRAAASAIAHWLFCLTPCTSRSHRRTAFWSSGSTPDAATSATHSSRVRPVRSAIESVTALIISSGVGTEGTLARRPSLPSARSRTVAAAPGTGVSPAPRRGCARHTRGFCRWPCVTSLGRRRCRRQGWGSRAWFGRTSRTLRGSWDDRRGDGVLGGWPTPWRAVPPPALDWESSGTRAVVRVPGRARRAARDASSPAGPWPGAASWRSTSPGCRRSARRACPRCSLSAAGALQRGIALRLRGVQPSVWRVVELAGLDAALRASAEPPAAPAQELALF